MRTALVLTLAVVLATALTVASAESATTRVPATLHARLHALRDRHAARQHAVRRARIDVSIRVTATVEGYAGPAIGYTTVMASDTQQLTAAWLETQLLAATNFRTAICGPNANDPVLCASLFDRATAFAGRRITHKRPNSSGSLNVAKMVTQRTYTVGDNAVGLAANHVLIVSLPAPPEITARAWAPGALAVHAAAAIPCGVRAYLFLRDVFITGCARALAQSHTLYGASYAGMRYTYSVADLRTIAGAGPGALPLDGSAIVAAAVVVVINQPVVVQLNAARVAARNAWNLAHPGQNVNNPYGTGNNAHTIARGTPATAAAETATQTDGRAGRAHAGRYGDGNPYHAGTQYPAAGAVPDARAASVAGHAYPWFPRLV